MEGLSPPLDLDPNEVIEADEETLPYAEEDWQDPEQMEAPRIGNQTFRLRYRHDRVKGQDSRKKQSLRDDFVKDRIDLKKLVEEMVGLEEITVTQDIDIVDDRDDKWIDDRSKPEVEFDDEQQQSYDQDLTNLRVLEWLNDMTSDPKETSFTIQDVDSENMKYITTERDDPSWAAQEGQLLIPASNLDVISGKSLIKNLRIARDTADLGAETGIRRAVESYFNLPNEYSTSKILTDTDFILTNRTCAITADMSLRTASAADFKREYKNIEFLCFQLVLEAKTRNRRRSSLASGGFADTRKFFMLLGDEGDGEAARGPGKLGLVLDEIERLPVERR